MNNIVYFIKSLFLRIITCWGGVLFGTILISIITFMHIYVFWRAASVPIVERHIQYNEKLSSGHEWSCGLFFPGPRHRPRRDGNSGRNPWISRNDLDGCYIPYFCLSDFNISCNPLRFPPTPVSACATWVGFISRYVSFSGCALPRLKVVGYLNQFNLKNYEGRQTNNSRYILLRAWLNQTSLQKKKKGLLWIIWYPSFSDYLTDC